MEFKGYRALACRKGVGQNSYQASAHKITPVYHYTHEHEQYSCIQCGERFTPLETVMKDKSDPESYIAKTLRFFRWRTTNE
jgi:hypothetical protein